jgi:hypothetical protein
VYYVHVTELLERFPTLNKEDAKKGLVMYQNFINLTEAIKTKANKLIFAFNFPIQLPDFYQPEKGLVDKLNMVVENASETGAGESIAAITKEARQGMKQGKYTEKDDQEIYFDCTILEKFDEKMHEFDKAEPKKDTNIDIMDFISKSDFSSVGGNNNAKSGQQAKKEETKVDIRT